MLKDSFQKIEYDCLIVGGGINGAAIAHVAALTGLRVALIEKNDWASGTSSKSTKLLHGGIRYLENFEFDLVAEALKERFIQYKSVPHLVKPLQFIIPVYKGQGRPMWMLKIGVWLYDVLSGRYALGGHQHLSKEDVLKALPGIKKEDLLGGVSYFDAQMNDSRIVLENVLMAKKYGADVANYVEGVSFLKENGHCVGMQVEDVHTKEQICIKAKQTIVAAGVWSDQLRHMDLPQSKPALRPTKGVHIICRGQIASKAVLLQSKADNRIFFAIPFYGNTLLGTTDTDFQGDPDKVIVEEEDINYLLSQAQAVFPSGYFNRGSIISSFVGLRPLVHDAGSPSKVSRKHVIGHHYSGVYYVMGGKYTTYRAIAVECIKKVFPKQGRKLKENQSFDLYGSHVHALDVKAIALQFGIEAQSVEYCMNMYGSRLLDALSPIQNDPSLRAKLCVCSPAIRAQVAYAKSVEMARTPEDIFNRRLQLVYNECHTKDCYKTIVEMFK